MDATAANDNVTAPVDPGALTLELDGEGRRLLARATIVPGKSVTLHGIEAAGHRYVKNPETGRFDNVLESPKPYANHFAIGDWAEVGAYNLVYTGQITKITKKTVTLVEYPGTNNAKTYRFTIAKFDRRNWDFDLAKATERNANWSD